MQKYFVEARQLLAAGIPVILAQVAQTAMGLSCTVMAGGYSATDMAAGHRDLHLAAGDPRFGHGLLLARPRVVAQLNGSGGESVSRRRCVETSGWPALSRC